VHWSNCLCSKQYPQNVPSPPGEEERASAFPMPNGWGEGGMNQPFLWAVTLYLSANVDAVLSSDSSLGQTTSRVSQA
jgi:hypothetical protein